MRDPIPASFYAWPPLASHTRAQTHRRSDGRRRVSDFINWPVRTQLLAAIGGLVSIIWIAQTPRRPTLGLLGFVTLVTIILATNARGVRSRLPFLRSENLRVAASGWGVIGGLMLVATVLAAVGPSSPSASPQHSRLSLLPSQTARSSLAAVTPSAQPTPAPLAARAPRPSQAPKQSTS